MDRFVTANTETLKQILFAIHYWLLRDFDPAQALAQLAVVAAGWLFAVGIGRLVRRPVVPAGDGAPPAPRAPLRRLLIPAVWLLLLAIAAAIASRAGWVHGTIDAACSLLSAWIVIRLLSFLVADPLWARVVAVVSWTVAMLAILGLIDPVMDVFDSVALSIAGMRISLLQIGEAAVIVAGLLWLACSGATLAERWLGGSMRLTPSARILVGKAVRIGLIALALIVGLSAVGIDLTAFAVLGGAIGVGLGFGLQKVVANLVSGVILLLDRSIKPGDVITIGDTFGTVNAMSARYASVLALNGREYLIPNEELIAGQVVNWSFTDSAVRVDVSVGIGYDADVRQAIALCLRAAREVPRVLAQPQPVCLLADFADSAIVLEVQMWVNDPHNGIKSVASDLRIGVWELFRLNGVVFPFPQLDVHLKGGGDGGVQPAPERAPAMADYSGSGTTRK